MSDNEWLKELKEGDQVILTNRTGTKSIETIERFTKTMIILKRSFHRMKLSNGHRVGGDVWNHSHIQKATPEKISHVKQINERHGLLSKFSSFRWNILEIEKLRNIEKEINRQL